MTRVRALWAPTVFACLLLGLRQDDAAADEFHIADVSHEIRASCSGSELELALSQRAMTAVNVNTMRVDGRAVAPDVERALTRALANYSLVSADILCGGGSYWVLELYRVPLEDGLAKSESFSIVFTRDKLVQAEPSMQ